MSETNTENNLRLISLARASEITGYHQDYLGQLCRLGKLAARKVGRNWFTTEDDLRSLTAAVNQAIEESELQEEPATEAAIAPELEQTITISRVEGLPIMIRTMPSRVEPMNNVQAIATNFRIQALQREVLELRDLLNRLMAEVTRHAKLLDGGANSELAQAAQNWKHQYVSNFDFNAPGSPSALASEPNPPAPQIWQDPAPKYSWVTIATATVVLSMVAYLATSAFTGMLWGNENFTQTVYYKYEENQQIIPAVPGEATGNVVQ